MTWRRVQLKQVASVAVSNVDKKSSEHERSVRLCNYVDVYKNDLIDASLDFMQATASPAQIRSFALRAGDTVITKDSETAQDIAVPAYVGETIEGLVCGYHLAVVRPGPEVDPRYLFWCLSSEPMRKQAAVAATGVTRFGLRQESIRNALLDVPSISDQRRISGFLDAETRRVERLAGLRQQQVALLRERQITDLSYALAKPFDGGTSRLRTLPWLAPQQVPLVKLGHVSHLQGGVTVDAGRELPGSVWYPYLRVANVQDGWIDLSEVKEIALPPLQANAAMLQPGDVLMTEGGDLDKLGRGMVWSGQVHPCLHQNHIFAIRPYPDALSAEYLALMTRTHHARCYFESTGVKTTNLASTNSSKIRAFRLPLRPLSEQRLLVREQERAQELVQALVSAEERQVSLLHERKQSLIAAAVTRELDVGTARGVA